MTRKYTIIRINTMEHLVAVLNSSFTRPELALLAIVFVVLVSVDQLRSTVKTGTRIARNQEAFLSSKGSDNSIGGKHENR